MADRFNTCSVCLMRAIDWVRLQCTFCGTTHEHKARAGLRFYR